MSLRRVAEADLGFIVEDCETGFGWPLTLTAPDGTSIEVVGMSNDISQVIDPETGVIVSGRLASIAIRMSTLKARGFDQPVGIADAKSKPWVVEFDDIGDEYCQFKISESNPDRAIGLIVCFLEAYE